MMYSDMTNFMIELMLMQMMNINNEDGCKCSKNDKCSARYNIRMSDKRKRKKPIHKKHCRKKSYEEAASVAYIVKYVQRRKKQRECPKECVSDGQKKSGLMGWRDSEEMEASQCGSCSKCGQPLPGFRPKLTDGKVYPNTTIKSPGSGVQDEQGHDSKPSSICTKELELLEDNSFLNEFKRYLDNRVEKPAVTRTNEISFDENVAKITNVYAQTEGEKRCSVRINCCNCYEKEGNVLQGILTSNGQNSFDCSDANRTSCCSSIRQQIPNGRFANHKSPSPPRTLTHRLDESPGNQGCFGQVHHNNHSCLKPEDCPADHRKVDELTCRFCRLEHDDSSCCHRSCSTWNNSLKPQSRQTKFEAGVPAQIQNSSATEALEDEEERERSPRQGYGFFYNTMRSSDLRRR